MNYADKISEDLTLLQTIEKQQTQASLRDYVRFIRLLKSAECLTQDAAARQVSLSLRQAQRVRKRYRHQGLAALIQGRPANYMGKLSTTHISYLRQFLRDDQAQTLADIQAYLSGSLGVDYTIGGISDLCKRLHIKRKKGRPVNVRQEAGAVETFKKSLAT